MLSLVSTIYAEDTRHTSNLLSYYGIRTPLVSLHEHNEHSRIKEVCSRTTRYHMCVFLDVMCVNHCSTATFTKL